MAWLAVDQNEEEYIYNEKPKKCSFCYTSSDSENYDAIYLPKGTIEKIIGRKLTWDDDPVEI